MYFGYLFTHNRFRRECELFVDVLPQKSFRILNGRQFINLMDVHFHVQMIPTELCTL